MALWNSSKPADYQYYLEHWSNGYSVPVHSLIYVENGRYKKQEPLNEYSESTYYLTITDIYKEINHVYLQYNDTTQKISDDYVTKIIIKYDEVNHIPVEIDTYYHVPPGLADEFIIIELNSNLCSE